MVSLIARAIGNIVVLGLASVGACDVGGKLLAWRKAHKATLNQTRITAA